MASWLILLIKQFVDIFKYILIGSILFDIEINKKKIREDIILYIIIMIIYVIFLKHIEEMWIDINIVICFIFLFIHFRSKLVVTLKIIVITIMANTFLEQITRIFVDSSNNNIHDQKFFISNIFKLIIVVFVMLIIKFYKIINRSRYDLESLPWYIYMNIIIGFSATLFPLYIVILYNNVLSKRLALMTTAIAYINIVISIICIGIFIKNKNEKEKYYRVSILKDKTLNLQKDYYQKLIDNYSDVRKFKHDIKGHLNIIDGLVRNCENKKASNYINEISKSIISKDIYHTNNIYISTILNSFDQVFKDENIKFELSYYITKHIIMESMDICSLFYNLISNAIESNLKITDERYIKLYIAEIKNNIVIKLVNPVDDDFSLNVIKENKTTKQDKENHGFGLITINNIVSKYRGSIDYSMMDNDLIIDIVLFNTLKIQD